MIKKQIIIIEHLMPSSVHYAVLTVPNVHHTEGVDFRVI